MSSHHYFTFFDRAKADTLWKMRWQQLLRKHPKLRAQIRDSIIFAYNDQNGNEINETACERLMETQKLSVTISRSTPPFRLMTDVLEMLPNLRRHTVEVKCQDIEPLLGVAGAAFNLGQISTSTLKAVLKICGISKPKLHYALGRSVPAAVDKVLSSEELLRPLYRWQGRAACRYASSGTFDGYDNCLGAVGTRLFIRFIIETWKANPVIPRKSCVDSLCGVVDGERFRDSIVAQELIVAARTAQRFERPSAIKQTS